MNSQLCPHGGYISLLLTQEEVERIMYWLATKHPNQEYPWEISNLIAHFTARFELNMEEIHNRLREEENMEFPPENDQTISRDRLNMYTNIPSR